MKYLMVFFLTAISAFGANIDYRALNTNQFSTNIPSPFYVGIYGSGVTNIPGTNVNISAGGSITFMTNGQNITISTTGLGQATNVFLIAGTDITIVTNGSGTWTISSSTFTNIPIVFVDTNGNDATAIVGNRNHPYKSFNSGFAAASDGSVIWLTSGQTFPVTNQIKLTKSLKVLAWGATVRDDTSGNITVKSAFKFSTSPLEWWGGIIDCQSGSNNTAPFVADIAPGTTTNFTFYDVTVLGTGDLMRPAGTITTGFHLLSYDSRWLTLWDGFAVNPSNTNAIFEFVGCSIISSSTPAGNGFGQAIAAPGGHFILRNCDVRAIGSVVDSNFAITAASGAIIDIYGGHIFAGNALITNHFITGSGGTINICGDPLDYSLIDSPIGATVNFCNWPVSDLWTNDLDGPYRILRPVDQTRMVENNSVGTNQGALNMLMLNTNAAIFTFAGYLENLSTNGGAKALYDFHGTYGGIGEVFGDNGALLSGEGVGLFGLADSGFGFQYGLAGLAYPQYANGTNVAVAGSALDNGKSGAVSVGGYFETVSATPVSVAQPLMRSAVVIADSRNTGNPLLIGRTNGATTYLLRSDGSQFIGKNVASFGDEPDFTTGFIEHISKVDSNDPPTIYWELDSSGMAGGYEANQTLKVVGNKDASDSVLQIQTINTNGQNRRMVLETAEGGSQMTYTSNSVPLFAFDDAGNLITVRKVSYSWPSAHGAASSVLTDTDGAGTLAWNPVTGGITGGTTNFATTNSNTGLTNATLSIITNNIPNFIHGTTNYIAKFTPNTNEVGNSHVIEEATNQWAWRSLPAGTAWTNATTNFLYSRDNGAGSWDRLSLIAKPSIGALNGFHELTAETTLSGANGNSPLRIQNAWQFNHGTVSASGNPVGSLTPLQDDVFDIGSVGGRVHHGFSGANGWTTTDTAAWAGPAQYGSGTYGFVITTGGIEVFKNSFGFMMQFQRSAVDNNIGLNIGLNYIGAGSVGAGVDALWDSFIHRGNEANTWSLCTNNASSGTPPAVRIEGSYATGTDHNGGDTILAGSRATGTGRGGAGRIQTSLSAASTSSSINTLQDRLYISPVPVTLTESSATLIFNVALASGKSCGIRVFATTKADDATDFQSVAESFVIAAVNKGGTVSTAISASAPIATVQSSGTLTTTWTAVANGNGVDVKCNAVSSLTQTTLNTRWRAELDGDGTLVVTAQ